jgi:AcrR family transcriptional regulator
MADGAGGRLRADAQRNREHILQVAHAALAESGSTSLNEIVKRAGVGAGTFYRHFPTRDALILAVYQHDLESVQALVDDLLNTHTPLDAFREWFHTVADYVRVKEGLGDALNNAALQDAISDTYPPMCAAVARLLAACAAENSLRSDLDPGDVLLLMASTFSLPSGLEGRKQANRMMDIVINGLRPTD